MGMFFFPVQFQVLTYIVSLSHSAQIVRYFISDFMSFFASVEVIIKVLPSELREQEIFLILI